MAVQLERNEFIDLLSFFSETVRTHSDQYLSTDKIWKELKVEGGFPSIKTLNDDEFGAARQYLTKFANVLKTLQTLTGSLQQELSDAKVRVDTLARHLGFNRLPDELLSTIMERAVSDFEDAVALSHVSTRFRSVALASPRVWARCELNLDLTPTQFSVIMQRSRGIPSTAFIDSRLHSNPTLQEKVVSCCSNLEALSFMHFTDALFYLRFEGARFPKLRSLTMIWDATFSSGDGDMRPCRTWSMPQLQDLYVNFPPLPQLGRNLRTCKIVHHSSPSMSVNNLLAFLAECPVLAALDVSFEETAQWQEIESAFPGTVSLPNLDSLAASAGFYTDPVILRQLLANLVAKSLSRLSIVLYETGDGSIRFGDATLEVLNDPEDLDELSEFESRCSVFLDFIRCHQSLKSIDISIKLFPENLFVFCEPRIPQVFLLNLPRDLETLVFTMCRYCLTIYRDSEQMNGKAVTVVHLRAWDDGDLTLTILRNLESMIRECSMRLGKIQVEQCPLIEEVELRECFRDIEVVYDA